MPIEENSPTVSVAAGSFDAAPELVAAPVASSPLHAAPMAHNFCYACGNTVDPRAFVCPACGVKQRGGNGSSGLGENAALVTLISAITSPVIGMALLRRWGWAVGYLVMLMIGFAAFLLPGVFVWCAGLIHVYRSASAEE